MKLLIAIVGAILGAVGAYSIALWLSTGDVHPFTVLATAVGGGVFLSAAFTGLYSTLTTTSYGK